MRIINADKTGTLRLGKTGENLVTCVQFDISKWVKELGDGTAVLCHIRPEDTEPYIISTTSESGIVSWDVTSTDTAQAGIGQCELQYIADDAVVKSKIWKTLTIKSLDDAGDTPDPESGWVADLISQITALVSTVPAVTIEDTETGAIITITDASGTTSTAVYDGEAATIDVGTVETGEPGTNVSVINSGTTSSAVFDFVIPRGDTGESAYEAAVSGGYTGTEEEFAELWASLETYTNTALTAAEAAATSEANAKSSETLAGEYAEGAWGAVEAAATSESNAATSEANASASATLAEGYAATASAAAEAATSYASAAASSASAAATSEANASASESNAASSASAAAESESNATSSATAAETAQTAAETAQAAAEAAALELTTAVEYVNSLIDAEVTEY